MDSPKVRASRPFAALPGALACLVAVVVLTGCLKSSSQHESTAPTEPVTVSSPATLNPATSNPATSKPVTSVAIVTTGGQTTSPPSTDPVAEAAAIRSAFETFFGGAATTVDAKVAVLQDGERYRSMLVDAAANAQFQAMTVDIRELAIGDPAQCAALGIAGACATVTFDLLVSGIPALVAQAGAAVQSNGRWLVASSAWCAVVAIGGESCP